MNKPLVLASASAGRAMILRDAGFEFEQIASEVDEQALKQDAVQTGQSLNQTALALAHAKAKKISSTMPGLVIGADQILGLDGQGFDKPTSCDEAHRRLMLFAGKTHHLHTGIVVYEEGVAIFDYVTAPALTMRTFTSVQISAYLEAAGPDVLATVGAYMLEAHGSRLFSHIDGDYFSIIGLPLLPLVSFLQTPLGLEF